MVPSLGLVVILSWFNGNRKVVVFLVIMAGVGLVTELTPSTKKLICLDFLL